MLKIKSTLDFESSKLFVEDFTKYNILNKGLFPAFAIFEDVIFLMESQKIEHFRYLAQNNSFNKDMYFRFKKKGDKFYYEGYDFGNH